MPTRNDKPPAELATLLANEVSAAVSKELETRMQQHTSQVEERVKAMLERFHSVTLQEIASIVAIAVQPPHHGHHQPPHHGATPFSHHPAHAMQPIKFQPQQLFAKAKESPPGSGPRPSDDSPPRPSSNRAAFDAAFAEEVREKEQLERASASSGISSAQHAAGSMQHAAGERRHTQHAAHVRWQPAAPLEAGSSCMDVGGRHARMHARAVAASKLRQ